MTLSLFSLCRRTLSPCPCPRTSSPWKQHWLVVGQLPTMWWNVVDCRETSWQHEDEGWFDTDVCDTSSSKCWHSPTAQFQSSWWAGHRPTVTDCWTRCPTCSRWYLVSFETRFANSLEDNFITIFGILYDVHCTLILTQIYDSANCRKILSRRRSSGVVL